MHVKTRDGLTFSGQLVAEALGDGAVVALLAPDDATGERVVIPLDSIATVEER